MTNMEYDFSKICRVCLNEGIMMSVFKVNISKKLMACAAVQVWQNDQLPSQICNKCAAKLHISYQFKKQCEKSDSKLRQYVNTMRDNVTQKTPDQPLEQPAQEKTQTIQQTVNGLENISQNHVQTAQQLPEPSQNNCVYIECSSLVDLNSVGQEPKFDSFIPVPVSQPQQPQITHINYNSHPQNHQSQTTLQLGTYNLQTVGPVQVYNNAYAMPLQPVQFSNSLHNQILNPQIHMTVPQQEISQVITPQLLPQQQTNENIIEEDKSKKSKIKKEGKNDDGNKQCLICNKEFSTPAKLSRHMKTHSSDMPHRCYVCNKAFSHSGNYKIHLRMHTDERPFRCTVCGKGCRQAQDLEKHMRTHTGERPHKCTLCEKAFSTSSNLIAHIRTHTGERPYVCCVCQKAFCQSNELTKHMRTHTGEKSHVCDICHKGFNGSSTLIVHRRSHTGERPYVCNVCSKGFAQSSCLAVHMKRHERPNEKLIKVLMNLQCSLCEKTFSTNLELKEHSLTHAGSDKFVCGLCDKSFLRAADYHHHANTHNDFQSEETS